jgi:hypothetical protein
MRNLVLLGAFVGAAMCTVSPSTATDGPWCLSNSNDFPGFDCSQPSYDVCRFAASPESGSCYRNPRYARYARAPVAVVYHAYWRPAWQDSWWDQPVQHRSHRGFDVHDFWGGYAPVMLRMPPSDGTQGPWCLSKKYTDCSQPSYEMCRFAASPESAYCFPNPYYRGASRAVHYMARAQMRHRHGGRMAVAALAAAPAQKVAAVRRASAHATTAAAENSALAEMVARVQDIDGTYGAFAMADDMTAANAVPNRLPAATASPGREQVKLASLALDSNLGTPTLAPAQPAPVVAPRKPVTAADRIPTINVMPSCRAAANAIIGVKQDVDVCLKSESSARDALALQWAEFQPAERASCVRLTTMAGGGTYTELLTCLDLKQFARNMHKDDPSVRVAGR